MRGVAVCAALIAAALGGCSWFSSANSSLGAITEQAAPPGQIAYDVVKVDDAVVKTVLAQTPPDFRERFKPYQPPPAQPIAVGDRLSVVIWESSPEGLFGYSLWDAVTPQGLPFSAAYAATSELANPAIGPLTPQPNDAAATAGQSGSLDTNLLAATGGQASTLNPAAAGALAQAAGVQGLTPQSAAAGALMGQPGAAQQLGGAGETASGSLGGAAGTPSAAQLAAAASMLLGTQQNMPASGLPPLPESLLQLGQYGRPGTRIPVQQVGTDGTISVPYAGHIAAAGHTPAEIAKAIEIRLAGKALGPQVLLTVQNSQANAVTVTGEAIAGSRVQLNPGGEHLLDVIAAAGGARAPIHDTYVQLSRDGVTASIPMARLVEHPEENIFARPGDVLTLVQRPKTFSVFGATGKNAAISFDQDRLTVSEALAKSGGLLDDQADPRAVFLFRYEPDTVVKALGQPLATERPSGVSPVAYRFDLKDPKAYLLAKEFPVRDKDIVFVANAEIQPVYRFFTVLQNVTGPVVTGFLTCQNGVC